MSVGKFGYVYTLRLANSNILNKFPDLFVDVSSSHKDNLSQ